MKRFVITGLFFLISLIGISQGEWNNWCFGSNAAMTFTSGSPIGVTGSALFQSAGGTSVTVSDSVGNLLFSSNGWKVWNKNNMVMPNGNGILGGNFCTQPVFVVPKIGDHNRYYLFTVGEPGSGAPIIGLHYSVIDMTLFGGLGDVIPTMKNIAVPFGDSAVDQLTGIRHKNNKDVWVVVRKHGTETRYQAYLVTASGISSAPVISNSNLPTCFFWQGGQQRMMRGGDLKISQDGTLLVCSDSLTEICDFNALTGVVIPKFNISASQARGAEFSVDSKYLYLCESGGNGPQWGYMGWQFDPSYQDSLNFVLSKITLGGGFGSKMQLAPNWKIYTGADPSIDSVHCINYPSLPGLLCNFQNNAVGLLGNHNNQCLVQFLQKYKAYIHQTGHCQNDSVHFSGDIWPPADSIHWDFGDPASGINNYSNLQNPTHIYSGIGTYTIELFVRHIDNRTDTAWKTIEIFLKPLVDLGPDQTICLGDSVTFDAGACSGCNYQWSDLTHGLLNIGTNQTYTAHNAAEYMVMVGTGTNDCFGTDTVVLVTSPVPVVTNSPLSKEICTGESTNITLTSNAPGTMFNWTATLTSGNITGFTADSGVVINQVLVNLDPTPGVVTYHITPKVGSCIGNPSDYEVTVNPGDSVKISIVASANNICSGTSVTFTATPVNGGINPVYQWKVNSVNSGTNSPMFTYAPNNGDLVQCVLTSSNTVCTSNNPATSNSITMTVNQNLPVSVSVTPSANPVCAGTLVTFTAIPTYGGTTPSYQWKVNGGNVGTNNSIYSYPPNNGDAITCTLTSSEICTTGNPAICNQIIMTVNPKLLVSISISASSNPFCIGNSVTFMATHTNGGSSPSYQWKVNGTNVSIDTLYTYYPVNGDMVSCVFTSSASCVTGNPATSNTITMTGTPGLPAGVSIHAIPNPFCPGSSVTCTATPVNGGTNPVYQWKVNGVTVGTNSPTYTFNPLNNDSLRCVMTSNLSCVSGNPASSNKIILSGTLAPIVTFTCCFDSITRINAKPIKLKGGIPLGGTYTGPGVNSITGVFTPSVAGIGTKIITYSYTNVALCSASKTKTIIVQSASAFICGNNLTDIRDGKVYPTLKIGSQCWMASNLNYGNRIPSTGHQRDNCTPEKYCYNELTANCEQRGANYQWDEMMQYEDIPGLKGLCPPGWHIPSETEWQTLFSNWTNNASAGAPLKYSGYSGFNALMSGVRHLNVQWDYQNLATFFWSSTPYGAYKAWAYGMNDYDPSVAAYPSSRANAFSIRCTKD